MANAMNTLIVNGLTAMRAGGEVAKQATMEIQDDATNERLRAALKQGRETSQAWRQRIEQALQEAGGAQGEKRYDILEAHYRVSKKIRQEANDDYARDLGIVASGQLALHYWIASFGTMLAYTKQVGMSKAADTMKQCMEEAKRADEQHTAIALEMMEIGTPVATT